MPDLLKRSLMRSALIIITIIGAVFVMGVIFNLREGTAHPWQVVLGLTIVVALILLNRWWYRQTGSRI